MFYNTLQQLCRQKGISVTEFAKQIGLSQSNVTTWKAGAVPRSKTLKATADYFGVSVEYLMGDDAVNVRNVQDNHGIIGHAHAPVTINGGGTASLSEQEEALLDLFRKMNVVSQAKLLVYAESVLNGQI